MDYPTLYVIIEQRAMSAAPVPVFKAGTHGQCKKWLEDRQAIKAEYYRLPLMESWANKEGTIIWTIISLIGIEEPR